MDNINQSLEKWLNDLNNFSFKDYENLPDLELYMEQVINYLERELDIFKTSTLDMQIKSSMINNYVKGEVVSAPIAKKYNREHLALIQEVCTLKQVLSIAEVKQVIDERYKKNDIVNADVFNKFKDLVNEKNNDAILYTKELLKNIDENNLNDLTDLAVNLAITANAYISISKRILFLQKLYENDLANKKTNEE